MRLSYILIGVAVLFTSGACKKETPPAPPAVVTVSPVITGVIAESLDLIGQVKSQEKVNLVARVKGFLHKKNFNEGDAVKKDTVLYEIEPYQYEADLKTAEASHQKALADKKNADADYARQEALYKGDAVSERVRDEALARKMECDAQVKATAAAIDNAKLQLSYTKIKAPFDGRVGLATYNVGNVVGPESGTLLTIVTTDPIDVEFSISEVALLRVMKAVNIDNINRDVVRVRLFLQNGMEYNLEGKITKRDNRVNPNTGMLKLKASFDNPRRLLVDGMYVKIRLEPMKTPEALIVPRQAVQENQDEKYVYIVNKEDIVERRTVTPGSNDELFVKVESGLEAGERVIVEGGQKVHPNVKVAPKNDERFASQKAAEALYEIKRPQKITFDQPAADAKAEAKPSAEDKK